MVSHVSGSNSEEEELEIRRFVPLGASDGSVTKEGPPLIVMKRRVYDAINKHTQSDLENEVGGLLLGKTYTLSHDRWASVFGIEPEPDPSKKMTLVVIEIENCIIAKHVKSSPTRVEFTNETWVAFQNECDERFPDKERLGWYHTHPNLGIFLSPPDLFLHQYFPKPNQVVLVVDPVGNTGGFFKWQEGQLDSRSYCGFYEDSSDPGIVPWKNLREWKPVTVPSRPLEVQEPIPVLATPAQSVATEEPSPPPQPRVQESILAVEPPHTEVPPPRLEGAWRKVRVFGLPVIIALLLANLALTLFLWNRPNENLYMMETAEQLTVRMKQSEENIKALEGNLKGIRENLMVTTVASPAPSSGKPVLAYDDFENGRSGGQGWRGDKWEYGGDGEFSVTDSEDPYQGRFHLRIGKGKAWAERSLDLKGKHNVLLVFHAKACNLMWEDKVTLTVCDRTRDPNPARHLIIWTPPESGVEMPGDNKYYWYSVSIDDFLCSSNVQVYFFSEIHSDAGALYVDDLKVVGE